MPNAICSFVAPPPQAYKFAVRLHEWRRQQQVEAIRAVLEARRAAAEGGGAAPAGGEKPAAKKPAAPKKSKAEREAAAARCAGYAKAQPPAYLSSRLPASAFPGSR